MTGSPQSAVREWVEPAAYVAPADVNAADDVFEWAARDPDHAAVSRKVAGEWQPMTSKEFADQVVAVAAGLIAVGIKPGDRVALFSATRFEWMLADFAIWAAGAVTVPIYETSSLEQVRWILSDSGAVAVFAENARLGALAERAGVASVLRIWQLGEGGLDELKVAGKDVPVNQVASRRSAVTAASPATIVYTSGTTGRPKGCTLSHRNLVAEVRNVARARGIRE